MSKVRLPKQKSRTALVKELDKWFSLFIRLRAADHNGMVFCFTSKKPLFWKDSQCGHWISRRHMSTRWDEINCQVQSVGENIFNQGNAPVFGDEIRKKYGQDKIDFLLIKRNNVFKAGVFELGCLIKEYKERVEKLKKEKGL